MSNVDLGYFERPGFMQLYETWADVVFETRDDKSPVFGSNVVLARLKEAADYVRREQLLGDHDIAELERVACDYALNLPEQLVKEIEEALYA